MGFYKKATPEDEVPEEFRFSPAKDSPFKDEQPYKSPVASPATDDASSKPAADAKHNDL
ncbi:selenom [Pungitius sinensis]